MDMLKTFRRAISVLIAMGALLVGAHAAAAPARRHHMSNQTYVSKSLGFVALSAEDMTYIVGGAPPRVTTAGGYQALLAASLAWSAIYVSGGFANLYLVTPTVGGTIFGAACGAAAAAANLLWKTDDWPERAFMAAVAAKASAIIGSAVFCNISASTIETAIRNMWKKHSPELLINEAVLAKAGPEWTGLGTSFNLGWVAYTPFNNARNALWSAEQDRADACNQTKEINTAQQCNDAILAEKKASYRFNRTVKELNIYLVEMASYLTQLQGNVTSNVTKTEILNDFGLPPTP